MVSIILFIFAIFFTICHLTYKKAWHSRDSIETFLSYILFFNMGLMGFLGAYAHVFLGPETAKSIWSIHLVLRSLASYPRASIAL